MPIARQLNSVFGARRDQQAEDDHEQLGFPAHCNEESEFGRLAARVSQRHEDEKAVSSGAPTPTSGAARFPGGAIDRQQNGIASTVGTSKNKKAQGRSPQERFAHPNTGTCPVAFQVVSKESLRNPNCVGGEGEWK